MLAESDPWVKKWSMEEFHFPTVQGTKPKRMVQFLRKVATARYTQVVFRLGTVKADVDQSATSIRLGV